MQLSSVNVRFEGKEYGFVTNGRGVINAVPFFDTREFMDPAVNWNITGALEVRAILLHHWAGWYGGKLDAKATEAQEFAQLVACARDHRARFGIGPAYNLIVFPSNRVWAVGRHGTHRAHTKGRDPVTRRNWNEVGRSVCVAGNLDVEPMHGAFGVRRAVEEALSWPGVIADVAIHEHGLTPTVNNAGVMFSQATACPGRNFSAWRAAGGLSIFLDGIHSPSSPTTIVVGSPVPSMQPDRWQEGYAEGYRVGYGQGAAAAGRAHQDGYEGALVRVGALIASPPRPNVPPAPVQERAS